MKLALLYIALAFALCAQPPAVQAGPPVQQPGAHTGAPVQQPVVQTGPPVQPPKRSVTPTIPDTLVIDYFQALAEANQFCGEACRTAQAKLQNVSKSLLAVCQGNVITDERNRPACAPQMQVPEPPKK